MRVEVNKEETARLIGELMEKMKNKGIKPPFSFKEVPEMIQALSIRPDILEAMMPLQQKLYFNGKVPRDIKEKIFVKVSTMNNCQFCTLVHTNAMKSIGFSDKDVENVKTLENLTEKDKAVLRYAEQVTLDANNVSEELFNSLKEFFNDGEIVEITLAIGLINLLNKFNDALRVKFNLKDL